MANKRRQGGTSKVSQRLAGRGNSICKTNSLSSTRRSEAYGSEFTKLKPLVLARDGYCCRKCRKSNHPDSPTNVVLMVDHIVGVARGGKTVMSNLMVLCSNCHASKLGSTNRRAKNLILSQAERIKKGREKSRNNTKTGWGDNWKNYE